MDKEKTNLFLMAVIYKVSFGSLNQKNLSGGSI